MSKQRRVRFEYRQDMAPCWTPRRPEFACAANSVSMMMPSIEPYFVRSAKAALPYLPAEVRDETETYIFQEAQHHGQHVVFNRILLGHYPKLNRLDRLMRRTYRRLEERRSLEFSLAFAATSETMAYSAARWAAEHRQELFNGADEEVSTLFLWHLAEEVEHKSAAHDVYRAYLSSDAETETAKPTFGSKVRLVGAMATALALVMFFVFAGTTIMLASERRLHHPVAWARLIRWAVMFALELLTNLALSLLPSFHPTDLVDPYWYEVWLREFDTDTGTLPVWSDADQLGIPAQSA